MFFIYDEFSYIFTYVVAILYIKTLNDKRKRPEYDRYVISRKNRTPHVSYQDDPLLNRMKYRMNREYPTFDDISREDADRIFAETFGNKNPNDILKEMESLLSVFSNIANDIDNQTKSNNNNTSKHYKMPDNIPQNILNDMKIMEELNQMEVKNLENLFNSKKSKNNKFTIDLDNLFKQKSDKLKSRSSPNINNPSESSTKTSSYSDILQQAGKLAENMEEMYQKMDESNKAKIADNNKSNNNSDPFIELREMSHMNNMGKPKLNNKDLETLFNNKQLNSKGLPKIDTKILNNIAKESLNEHKNIFIKKLNEIPKPQGILNNIIHNIRKGWTKSTFLAKHKAKEILLDRISKNGKN